LWYTTVIPAARETEIGWPEEKWDPVSKKKNNKVKGVRIWLKW
jgi:hypothetical protein